MWTSISVVGKVQPANGISAALEVFCKSKEDKSGVGKLRPIFSIFKDEIKGIRNRFRVKTFFFRDYYVFGTNNIS